MMARPSMGARTNTAVRFPAELHARLEKEAARRDVSLNQLVLWASERALMKWEEQDLDSLIAARDVLRGDGPYPRHLWRKLRALEAEAGADHDQPEGDSNG